MSQRFKYLENNILEPNLKLVIENQISSMINFGSGLPEPKGDNKFTLL